MRKKTYYVGRDSFIGAFREVDLPNGRVVVMNPDAHAKAVKAANEKIRKVNEELRAERERKEEVVA